VYKKLKDIMKTFLFLIYFFISFSGISQSTISAGGERISYYTPNRDTLWLVNKEIGRLIASTWEMSTDVKLKPVIVLVETLPVRNDYLIEAKYVRTRKRKDQ
jgi:hypothetical protein